MKKKRDSNYFLIIIFCLILVLLLISDNTIFGSKIDWLAQHIAFPDYFRNLFYQTLNPFPSFAFSLGAGQNIYNFSYYGLYNPLIVISYLFPFIKMSTYISILNMCLFIALGCLLYYFLKSKTEKNIALVITLILMSASPILFHFHRHFMFVDYLPFLILGMIGTDKYIESNKMSLVSISIFLIILISYYYSVTCILVLCIYAVYRYLEYNKKIDFKEMFKKGSIYLIPIFTGIMSTGILLLPTLYTLMNGRSVSKTEQVPLLEKLTPIFNGDAILYGNYSMGLTAISLIALVYGIFSKKKENKFLSITISVILNIPIFIYILNGNLYFRNKILIPLIPLMGLLLIEFINKIINKKISLKHLSIVGIALVYLFLISSKTTLNNVTEALLLMVDIIFLIVSIHFYKKDKIKKKMLLLLLLMTPIITVLSSNYVDDYVSEELIEEVEDIKTSNSIKDTLKEEKNIVRFNNLDNTVYNFNRVYSTNYNQNSVYSSVSNKEYQSFYEKVFREAKPYRNKLMYSQNNDILFQTFMGVKYIYSTKDVPIGYEKISDNVYKNDNTIPVLYGTSNIISADDFNKLEYPNNISALLSGAVVKGETTNTDTKFAIEKFTPDYEIIKSKGVRIIEEENKKTVISNNFGKLKIKLNNINKDEILIINIKLKNRQDCKDGKKDQRITINDISNVLTCNQSHYKNNNKTFHYVLSDDNKIDTLNVILNKGIYKIEDITTYKLNYNSIKNIKKNQSDFIPDTTNIGDTISGKINMTEDGYFVTSIPYDKGFNITVDGQKQEITKVNKAFVGFKLNKGEHKIVINYQSPYQKEGIVLSIIGLIGIVILIRRDIKLTSKNNK